MRMHAYECIVMPRGSPSPEAPCRPWWGDITAPALGHPGRLTSCGGIAKPNETCHGMCAAVRCCPLHLDACGHAFHDLPTYSNMSLHVP
jgi:hypothetical protein